MPSGKGFIDKSCINYAMKFSKESSECQKLRNETISKLSCSQMISDLESAEILKWLLRVNQTKRALEVGVFTGYTTLLMAQTIGKDGVVVGIEKKQEFVDVGRPFWKEAGVDHKISIHFGDAGDCLKQLVENKTEPFDFAFIDADKKNLLMYFEYCLKLVRSGGIIAIDNVFFFGRVWDENDDYKNTPWIREFNETVAKDERVDIVVLPVSDGLTLCYVK